MFMQVFIPACCDHFRLLVGHVVDHADEVLVVPRSAVGGNVIGVVQGADQLHPLEWAGRIELCVRMLHPWGPETWDQLLRENRLESRLELARPSNVAVKRPNLSSDS